MLRLRSSLPFALGRLVANKGAVSVPCVSKTASSFVMTTQLAPRAGALATQQALVASAASAQPVPFASTKPNSLLIRSSPGVLRSSVDGRRFASTSTTTREADIGYYTAEQQQHYLKSPGGDPTKRTFTYFVLGTGRFVYSAVVRLIALKLIYTMTASADVLALANVEVDVSALEPGTTMKIKWRGKPVFIRHRSEEDIADARSVNLAELKDPQTDADRFVDPKWLVVIGVCTHLGCVPIGGAGQYGGWFCPCHGSHYDSSGRIRLGPAPLNLEIPPYKFISDITMVIG